jgi:hypothetical protein
MTAEARMSPGPQHMQALQRANAVRLARAELKRRVAIGEMCAADVILDAPWEAESMTVSDLLTSQRRWGHTRCRKFLQCVPMSENKTVGSMTDRQRHALAQMLAAGGTSRTAPERAEAAPERAEGLTPVFAGMA